MTEGMWSGATAGGDPELWLPPRSCRSRILPSEPKRSACRASACPAGLSASHLVPSFRGLKTWPSSVGIKRQQATGRGGFLREEQNPSSCRLRLLSLLFPGESGASATPGSSPKSLQQRDLAAAGFHPSHILYLRKVLGSEIQRRRRQ